MPKVRRTRTVLDKELVNIRKATETTAGHLQRASGDLATRLVALEKMVEKGLTSDELWDRLEAIERELEDLRITSEAELAKLRTSSERELMALMATSRRVARIVLSGTRPMRATKKPAAMKAKKEAKARAPRKKRPGMKATKPKPKPRAKKA
jgi:hypothetical protein